MKTGRQDHLIQKIEALLQGILQGDLKDYFLQRAREISPLQYNDYIKETEIYTKQYASLFKDEEKQERAAWVKRKADKMLEELSWLVYKEADLRPDQSEMNRSASKQSLKDGINQIYFKIDSMDVGRLADRVNQILKRCMEEGDFLDAYRMMQALFSIRIVDRYDEIHTFYDYIHEYDLNRAHFFFNTFAAIYFCADESVKFAQMAQLFEIGIDQNPCCAEDFYQPLTRLTSYEETDRDKLADFLPLWLEFLMDWADRELEKRGAFTPFPFYEIFELARKEQLEDLTRQMAPRYSMLLPKVMDLFYFYPYQRVYIALAILETYGLQDHPAAKKAYQILEQFKGELEEPELLRLKKLWKEDRLYKKLRDYEVDKAWDHFYKEPVLSSYLAAYHVFVPEKQLIEKLNREFAKKLDSNREKERAIFQRFFLEGCEPFFILLSEQSCPVSQDFFIEEIYLLMYLFIGEPDEPLFDELKKAFNREFLADLEYWKTLHELDPKKIQPFVKVIEKLIKERATLILDKRKRKDYQKAALLLAMLEKFLDKYSDSYHEGERMIRTIRRQYGSLKAFLKELDVYTRTGLINLD